MLILNVPTFFSEINWFLNSKAAAQVMTRCKSGHSSYMSLSNTWWMCSCSPVRPFLEWHQPAWHPGRAWPNPLFQTTSEPTCCLKNSRQLWDKSSFVLSVLFCVFNGAPLVYLCFQCCSWLCFCFPLLSLWCSLLFLRFHMLLLAQKLSNRPNGGRCMQVLDADSL